jgi:hypothetical protein
MAMCRFRSFLFARSVVDGQRFWISASPDLPFCQLKLVLSRDLNLYRDFSVLVDDCQVDDKMTLKELGDFSELIGH